MKTKFNLQVPKSVFWALLLYFEREKNLKLMKYNSNVN